MLVSPKSTELRLATKWILKFNFLFMHNFTPVGHEESQIGRIEDLMATPERKVKRVGERAVVRRSSGEIEADWVIEKFDPETGAVTVGKADVRGRILTKEIPRDEYFKINFPKSDEMFFSLENERKKVSSRAAFNESSRKVIGKELEGLMEVKDAFTEGDVGTVRHHFVEQVKKFEKQYEGEDETQRRARERALKEMEKIEKTLAKLERYRLGSRGSERDADDLAIINSKEDLQGAKTRFEDANRRLGAGHSDLDRLREFVVILDQEIEKRGERAAA